MSSTGKVSDEEVLCAIRYLDPDLQDDAIFAASKTKSRSARWHKAGLLIASPCVSLYFAAQRYLSAIMRLLN